jgi:hypothetical protein
MLNLRRERPDPHREEWLQFALDRLAIELRKEIRDSHSRLRCSQRRDVIPARESKLGSVAPSIASLGHESGIPVHLHAPVEEVHDPVICDTCPCVKASLLLPIVKERRVGNLHREEGRGRMSVPIVSQGTHDHRDVRFGFRGGIEPEGKLHPDMRSCTKSSPKCLLCQE